MSPAVTEAVVLCAEICKCMDICISGYMCPCLLLNKCAHCKLTGKKKDEIYNIYSMFILRVVSLE